jgi:hypothetical protein
MARTNPRWLPITALAVLYALLYLYAIGDLDFGRSGWSWQALDWQWCRLLARRSAWHFEAVAMLELGYLVLLLSPANLTLAGLLAVLLALNLHGALALRAQARCSLRQSAASSVGLWPALLAGGACCAPSLLLLLAIPGLGVFVGLFAAVAVAASRCWQRRRGAPRVLGWL